MGLAHWLARLICSFAASRLEHITFLRLFWLARLAPCCTLACSLTLLAPPSSSTSEAAAFIASYTFWSLRVIAFVFADTVSMRWRHRSLKVRLVVYNNIPHEVEASMPVQMFDTGLLQQLCSFRGGHSQVGLSHGALRLLAHAWLSSRLQSWQVYMQYMRNSLTLLQMRCCRCNMYMCAQSCVKGAHPEPGSHSPPVLITQASISLQCQAVRVQHCQAVSCRSDLQPVSKPPKNVALQGFCMLLGQLGRMHHQSTHSQTGDPEAHQNTHVTLRHTIVHM